MTTNKLRTLTSLLLATVLMGWGVAAQADSFTVGLDVEFSGATEPESATTPWVTFTVDDGGTAGSVDFTITAVNLTDAEIISEFYFNFNPTLDAVSDVSLLIASIDDTYADWVSFTQGTNCCKADGAGDFDFAWNFAPPGSNVFTNGDTFSWTLTGDGLTAADFNYLSTDSDKGQFTAAAHIQRIGADNNDSGWIGGSNGTTTVPEPGTLALLGLGLTAMGIATRRRKTVA